MSAGILVAQFSTEGDPLSAAIRYFSNGSVSHVDLVLPDRLLGARLKGGVQLRPPNYAKFTYIRRLQVEVPNVEYAVSFGLAQIGKPYNWRALVDMGLHRKRKFSIQQKSWFCDELIYAICLIGGTQLLNTDNPLNLTPEEVMLSPDWKAA